MSSKHAVVILSDPAGGEESLGRAFNALAFAADAQRAGDEVKVLFAGAGTRWPAELSRLGHPAAALYQAVRPLVSGASCGCSDVFGSREGLEACGVPLLRDNELEGTSGLASVRALVAQGFSTLLF